MGGGIETCQVSSGGSKRFKESEEEIEARKMLDKGKKGSQVGLTQWEQQQLQQQQQREQQQYQQQFWRQQYQQQKK